ncbi:MAG TPA: adenylate/guanylate cyclase domain-containing protein [Solirubrobacteraceae bacterium]|nr:adenylate/guanylate cyclase domain-containing protein [Solirubrobacteraceae bacterium]
MRARRQRLRTGLLVATGLAAGALGAAAWATDAFEALEVRTVDARFDVRGAERPSPEVVVVGLDEQSLADLDRRPPLPRSLHARVIDRLRRDGARVIAYDFEFNDPTAAAEDNALIEATRRAGNVVLATSRIDARGRTQVFGGAEGLAFARARVGSTVLDSIAGRVYRFSDTDRGIPSFPVAAVRRAGRAVENGGFEDGEAWIDYAGPPGTYASRPFSRVLAGRFRPGTFRGKIVVVGSTAPVLKDLVDTPPGDSMPGPELNANAIATVLDGFPLGEAPGGLGLLLVALLGIVVPAAAVPLRGLRWLPVPLLALGLYLAAVQLAFGGGTILPVVPALIALAAGTLGTLAVAYATELRDRRRLRETFGRFVPPAVVDEVVAQADEDLRLTGRRCEGTVLFSDLRGFTSCAEKLAAEQVIELLNRYLTEMSEAILDAGGTVVSYMGDGIMAVFGAPLDQDDHADRALRAAREMLDVRLPRFNAWARDFGLSEGFAMGIGICSGPVMSGNVGSARRLEYTAVGDTTNTASRLEAMTKEQGVPVLISDATRAGLRGGGAEDLGAVGELAVRGRSAPLTAWTFRDGKDAG